MHWEDPEGSGGEQRGRGDRDGEYMYIHGWFMSMYDKNHYNKKKKKKKQNKKQKKLEASSLYNKEVLSHHTWWLNYAWEKELF